MTIQDKTIAIMGGTGALGSGLAFRLAGAGFKVLIGSRSKENAENAAASINESLKNIPGKQNVCGEENLDAADRANIIILAVPYAQHKTTLELIKPAASGKIVVDTTVPLMPPKVGTVQLPSAGCAATEAQAALEGVASVVSAFQTVAADKLRGGDKLLGDVLVCGNVKDDCQVIIELVNAIGMRGYYAGPVANSAASEALTSVLITINRQFKCQAGIQIVGAN